MAFSVLLGTAMLAVIPFGLSAAESPKHGGGSFWSGTRGRAKWWRCVMKSKLTGERAEAAEDWWRRG
jgi:hypothetical protein